MPAALACIRQALIGLYEGGHRQAVTSIASKGAERVMARRVSRRVDVCAVRGANRYRPAGRREACESYEYISTALPTCREAENSRGRNGCRVAMAHVAVACPQARIIRWLAMTGGMRPKLPARATSRRLSAGNFGPASNRRPSAPYNPSRRHRGFISASAEIAFR